MSTSSSGSERVLLPDEIWICIFRWATLVDGMFDIEQDPFIYPGLPSQDEIQKKILASYSTKRRMCMVCRTWDNLATPFLYECVVIPRMSNFQRLRSTLAPENPAAWAKASFTRRLDFRLRTEGSVSNETIKDVLSMLVNLEIFVLRGRWVQIPNAHPRPSLLHTLTANAAPTLKFIDLGAVHFADEIDEETILVPSLNCETFKVSPTYITRDIELALNVHGIHRLKIPWQCLNSFILLGEDHRWYPSLRHLCISGWTNFEHQRLDLGNCGMHLVSLEIPDDIAPHPSHDYPDIGQPIQEALDYIMRSCPNLQHLIFTVTDGSASASIPRSTTALPIMNIMVLPPVRKLGLNLVQKIRLSKTRWRELLGKILPLCVATTTISVVRLIGYPTKDELALNHEGTYQVFRDFAASFASQSIKLEDRYGRHFSDDEC